MTNILARQAIGVEQPPSGSNSYPFVSPSTDIKDMIADFYLAIDDSLNQFKPPFRISVLANFGTYPNPSKPLNTPAGYGLTVVDADNRVMFTSLSGQPVRNVTPWPSTNPRMDIVEWITSRAVCRIVVHTGWSDIAVSENITLTYYDYILPINGVLNGRTVTKVPSKVNRFVIGNSTVAGHVEFAAGHNMQITENAATEVVDFLPDDLIIPGAVKTVVAGSRVTHSFEMAAVVGAGLGIVSGCQEIDPVIRRIGGAGPDESGNLNLDMSECLKINRPLELTGESPREAIYSHPDLLDEDAQSALVFGNDCKPCNDCSYYVRVYKGLKRQWNRWKEVAIETAAIRDRHQLNIDRWLASKDCRESNPLKVLLVSQVSCNVAAGTVFCNTSKCCLKDVLVRFTFESFRNGQYYPANIINCSGFQVQGSTEDGKDTPSGAKGVYIPDGSFPIYEITVAYLNPQESLRVSFSMCANGCTLQDNLRVTASVHFPTIEPNAAGVECPTPGDTAPVELLAIWTANDKLDANLRFLKTSELIPLNPVSAYCSQCTCTPEA